MKNSINKNTDSLKKSMDSVSQKSKENIKALVNANTRQFESAMESNTKTFNAISKMLIEKDVDPSLINTLKSAFSKSLKLSEDVIDSIIDSHTRRIDLSIDFTSRFMQVLTGEDLTSPEGIDKLVNLLKENFDKSTELSMRNMEKTISVYNDHLNLALNFNKKFAENINAQLNSMFALQMKSIGSFFSMGFGSDWWKTSGDK